MSDALLYAAAAAAGLAAALALWALRAPLAAKFARDQEWMRATYARFQPEPVNARAFTLTYYAAFAALLVLLLMLLPPVFAAAAWIAALFVPGAFVRWAWARRKARIDLQIPQTVATLANSMRAGLSLVQAITRLSEQAPEPIRSEFKIMANQYAYGADMETVIRNAKARLDLPNFSLFASALLLNREMGGDVADTLTRISKSLEKLREMRRTVEAHTAEGRTNIKVLLAAPVFILLVMAAIVPAGVRLLFTSLPGLAILTIALLLAAAGAYMASRITKAEI